MEVGDGGGEEGIGRAHLCWLSLESVPTAISPKLVKIYIYNGGLLV